VVVSDDRPAGRGSSAPPEVRIGVDLGGTKIEAIAMRDGDELVRRRVPTPSGYEDILLSIRELVSSIEIEVGRVPALGVGTPGAICPTTGRLESSNTTALNGRALDVDLAAVLERRIVIENDANCFALSEATDGAAAHASPVFGVILGTGVGGGIVIGGRLVRGPNALSGEWGHNPLPYADAWERPGPPCYCGKRGCVETWLSGAGLRREFLLRTGHHLEAPAIAELAARGEPEALATLARYADRLARALSVIINVVDPEVIVLGGGLSNLASLYGDVPERWAAWSFAESGRARRLLTRLLPARWGDSSGVRGAARLVGA